MLALVDDRPRPALARRSPDAAAGVSACVAGVTQTPGSKLSARRAGLRAGRFNLKCRSARSRRRSTELTPWALPKPGTTSEIRGRAWRGGDLLTARRHGSRTGPRREEITTETRRTGSKNSRSGLCRTPATADQAETATACPTDLRKRAEERGTVAGRNAWSSGADQHLRRYREVRVSQGAAEQPRSGPEICEPSLTQHPNGSGGASFGLTGVGQAPRHSFVRCGGVLYPVRPVPRSGPTVRTDATPITAGHGFT